MNKQIEEILEIFAPSSLLFDEANHLAEALYNAGYRKQIEGEWQTSPDGTHWCSVCGHDATYTFDGTEICGVACPFCGAHMKGD